MSKITPKMTDLFDNVAWDDMGIIGNLADEFEEDAIKYLRIERGCHHFPHRLTTCSLV